MRVLPLSVIVGLPLVASACSDPGAGTAGNNSVDVAAAALRGQSDIANYAAAARAARAAPVAMATAPRPAPPPKVAAPATEDTPEQVVRRYTDALAARRYAEAWRLWEGRGTASGMTEQAFADSFARYARFDATVGTPIDADAGAGQRFITVPVVVTGVLRSGERFRLEGPVILHKVADGIESDDPDAHAWRIRNSEMKPRPIVAAQPKP